MSELRALALGHHEPGEVRRAASLERAVRGALDSVTDPELDRSLLELGFATAEVDGEGRVTVEVRLPTFWCAPNFAYLMVQDARDAIAAVPGVSSVSVRLLDHFSADEVTRGVGEQRSFDESFGGLSDGQGLESLRRLFQVKAFTAAQERVLRQLQSDGCPREEITELRLADVDLSHPEGQEYLGKRRRLGLPVEPDQPLAILPNGQRLTPDRLEEYLRRGRSTRMNIEANTVLCQGLHATRYGTASDVEVTT